MILMNAIFEFREDTKKKMNKQISYCNIVDMGIVMHIACQSTVEVPVSQ